MDFDFTINMLYALMGVCWVGFYSLEECQGMMIPASFEITITILGHWTDPDFACRHIVAMCTTSTYSLLEEPLFAQNKSKDNTMNKLYSEMAI